MIVTFISHSTRVPSGGILAIFEFAGALSRLGHDVNLVHRWHPYANDIVRTVDEISWFRFDDGIRHHFIDSPNEWPPSDFTLAAFPYASLGGRPPSQCGLPVMLVQGDLTGTEKLRARMRAPFPKLCVARWLIAVGREEGVPDEQLVHLPYGISHRTFRLTAPIERRPMQVAMLYARHPKKGARYGIEALDQVKSRLPNLRAVLFGTMAPDRPVPSWITYVRSPDRDVLVQGIYNRSSVFVQASLREGFGFTPVEAMACGCALVTTSNGGSDDYAIDGVTALVTDPEDVDTMARRIQQLLLDDQARVGMAVRGNEFVKRFDWDVSARRLEAFLREYGATPSRYQASVGGSG